mmetsp:Transcript_19371/g.48133  ORF Transcript_19371/g.48133 Transcript_19371/m.48133 type:complete len:221 (-) Transcript_19371:415-1077(-)
MHDGDQKTVTFNGLSSKDSDKITIKPYANSQTWEVDAAWSQKFQNASIDFNVPGKPGPPPVNLTLTYKMLFGPETATMMGEFTDPTGTLAAPTLPLNAWISESKPLPFGTPCASLPPTVFADMHDGDRKQITISDGALTIVPSGNNESWVVKASLDKASCNATIDFDVPGKPNPPPVKLTAVLQQAYDLKKQPTTRTAIFYDPSGTIAPASQPLNAWLSI